MTQKSIFFRAGALVALVAGTSWSGAVFAKTAADSVFRNGKVFTADAQNSVQQAVAVKDGRIVYVGDNAGVSAFLGSSTKVFDLGGKLMLPGLIDGHIHPIAGGSMLNTCSLEFLPLTEQQFLDRIQTCLDAEPNAGEDSFLRVTGWYRQFMQPIGTDASRDTLDRLNTRRPIAVMNRDGHSTLVNSRALELAGIDDNTPNPADGSITRDANGRATGILEDGARGLLPETPEDPQQALRDAETAIAALTHAGVTTMLDAIVGEDSLKLYRDLQTSGLLTVRVYGAAGTPAEAAEDPSAIVSHITRLRDIYDQPEMKAEPGIRFHTAKIFLDGVIQAPAQTAGLVEPYWVPSSEAGHTHWQPGQHYGPIYIQQGRLEGLILELTRADITPHVHAIGDRAVKKALDAFEKADSISRQKGIRPEIAHAELVEPEDYGRFSKLNTAAIMSYQWTIPAPNSVTGAKDYLGPERFERMEPFDKLHAAGAVVAYGSDWPVDRLNYWLALKAGITRAGDDTFSAVYPGRLNNAPGLDRTTALRSITINGAWALGAEKEIGSVEVGKFADLIVIDRDFTTVPDDTLADNSVLLTMVGGKVVYSTGAIGK